MIDLRRATHEDLPAIVALQHAAYAGNREIMGVEPLPLRADYDDIFTRHECWIVGAPPELSGCLILELRPDDLLIWSVATAPAARSNGIGNELLRFAEQRATETGRKVLRLYTNATLTRNVAWYTRHGFAIERIEQLADRRAVHMKKTVGENEWRDDSQARPPS